MPLTVELGSLCLSAAKEKDLLFVDFSAKN